MTTDTIESEIFKKRYFKKKPFQIRVIRFILFFFVGKIMEEIEIVMKIE